MNGRDIFPSLAVICGTCICLYALHLGYDGDLALGAVLALFAAEKLLKPKKIC